MPPWGKRESKHSFRLRNLRADLSEPDFKSILRRIAEAAGRQASPEDHAKEIRFNHSLVLDSDGEFACATVSCSSAKARRLFRDALYDNPHETRLLYCPPVEQSDFEEAFTVKYDNIFDKMTVMHSPKSPDVDVIVVHGVNGNAMDTFAVQNEGKHYPHNPHVHWARDLLKSHRGFQQARIMTWDYASYLFSRSQKDVDPSEWPEEMLNSIQTERTSQQERARPIVFIGYSYGGILIREAAILLNGSRQSYDAIDIRKCGFVFLATPHVGSRRTISSPFFVQAATKFWFRGALHDRLKTLNTFLDSNDDAWWAMKNSGVNPPLVCFSEQRRTNVAPFLLQFKIVDRASAKFMGVKAVPLPGTDHHSICQFADSSDQNWKLFAQKVQEVKSKLHYECSGSNDASSVTRDVPEQGSLLQQETGIAPFSRATTVGFCLIMEPGIPRRAMHLSKVYEADSYPKKLDSKEAILQVANNRKRKAHGTAILLSDRSNRANTVVNYQAPSPARLEIPELSLRFPRSPESVQVQGPDRLLKGSEEMLRQVVSLPRRDGFTKVSVLSIDGGGNRGYVSLLILEELMKRVDRIEAELGTLDSTPPPSDEERPWASRRSSPAPSHRKLARQSSLLQAVSPRTSFIGPTSRDSSTGPPMLKNRSPRSSLRSEKRFLPCHYFDYIVGSESGGVLAMMLGRLRMSVNDCLTNFSGVELAMYGSWDPLRMIQRFQARRRFKETVRKVAWYESALELPEDQPTTTDPDQPFQSDEDLCKTIVLAAHQGEDGIPIPRFFRSYDNSRSESVETADDPDAALYQGPADTMPLHQVAQATIALQTSTRKTIIGGEKFVDGTYGLTNPTYEAIQEINAKESGDERAISTLVSIGSGKPRQSKDQYFKPHLPIRPTLNTAKLAAFDREDTHRAARGLLAGPGGNDRYFRFNTTAGSRSNGFPKESLRKNMTDPDHRYVTPFDNEVTQMLNDESTDTALDRCARKLVERRRQRAQVQDEWRRFSTASCYRCSLEASHEAIKFRTESKLVSHYIHSHPEWWESQGKIEREDSLRLSRRPAHWLGGPERPSSPLGNVMNAGQAE